MKRTLIAAVSLSILASAGSAFVSIDSPASPETRPVKREKPIAKGETMPGFELRNEKGETVRLADALQAGPVVVTFYRGTWCPYCVKALDSIDESVAEINELGAQVYAISPQLPEHVVDLREKTGLTYELLVDTDNKLAERLGLMFTLDADTIEQYKKYGIDVGALNGADEWQLPIPATYVIDTDGAIRYAWTDEDYRKRAPVSAILKTLAESKSEG